MWTVYTSFVGNTVVRHFFRTLLCNSWFWYIIWRLCARIKGSDKKLHSTVSVRCNYSPLPLIPASGKHIMIWNRRVGHLVIYVFSSRFSTSSWSWSKTTEAYDLIAHLSFHIPLVCEAPGLCEHIIVNQIYQHEYTKQLKSDSCKANNIFFIVPTKLFSQCLFIFGRFLGNWFVSRPC